MVNKKIILLAGLAALFAMPKTTFAQAPQALTPLVQKTINAGTTPQLDAQIAQIARGAIEAGTISQFPEHTQGFGWHVGIPLQDYVYGRTKQGLDLDPLVFKLAPENLIAALRQQATQGYVSSESARVIGQFGQIY